VSVPRLPREEASAAAHEVEEETEELGDPEASPANPSAAIAAQALRRLGPARAGGTQEIWRLAWPVMASQVLASVVGLVDIAMVGRLGAVSQAAVGYATQLFFLCQAALFAIGFACVALMARAIGARDPERARRALAASIVLALGVAAVILAAIELAPERILGWLSAAPDVAEICIPYLRLVMVSSLLLAVSLTLESGLRADRNTKLPMRIAIVTTSAKIALNYVLIFGAFGAPALGVMGAGLATLLAQVVAFALFVGVTLRTPRGAPTALRRRDFRGMGELMPELVRIAMPGVAERLVMNLAMLSYFALLGSYGTAAAAAYTIGIRILSFSWIPGTGYSQAVGTVVGQSLGARDPGAATRATRRAMRLAIGTAVVMGLAGALLRVPLAKLFTVDETTIAALGPFMLCLALAQPAMQLHFTLAGAFRGAGDTWTPLLSSLFGNWALRVPLAWILKTFELPLTAIWVALIFDHLGRAGWLLLALRRGAWSKRSVRA
jgi:putative MATE family efflux protein